MDGLMVPTIERAVTFGPASSLVGVVTEPIASARIQGAPTVVILNAGIIHRVGPNRLHVALARELAARGFLSLRFDLSGLGDSEPRKDALPLHDGNMADIRAALDAVSAATSGVVLLGLCSGADNAIAYASSDERVVGAILLDPSIPRTRGYYLRHLTRRVQSAWSRPLLGAGGAEPFKHSLSRLVRLGRDAVSDSDSSPLQRPEVRQFLQDAYSSTMARGVRVLGVLTGGLTHRHNHSRQLLEAFPTLREGPHLRLAYLSDSDHTFTRAANRTSLIQLVVEWLTTTFTGA
jgi:pimeloyl-ACP methyl ester carboxylesterase